MKSLEVSNFKAFKKITIPKLGMINLIVGKNNSGKSSILEALMVYASGGSETTLRDISLNHDEKYRQREVHFRRSEEVLDTNIELDQELNFNESYPYEHLFYGRIFNKNQIKIGEVGDDANALTINYSKKSKATTNKQQELFEALRNLNLSIPEPQSSGVNILEVKKGRYKHEIPLDDTSRGLGMFDSDERSRSKFNYVETSFDSMDELGLLWDKITLTDYENTIISALRLIEPTITDLRFVSKFDRVNRRTAIIRLEDGTIFPIRSMGDGIVRIMDLILNLYSARDGFFLVDEFDNGLHFSVQKPLWEIIFYLSKRLNVQIFATTHSWDCIQSFTEVAVDNNDIDGVLLKIGKSKLSKNKGQSMVTVFDEYKLHAITQKMVEVR